MLLSVMLGMRESHEDWLALGSDLIARGLGAPLLIAADGAPGLTGAVEQCWPASDRQHCAVHRLRNLLAKLPERERVHQAYWQALDDAIDERDAKQRLKALVDELEAAGYTAAAKCLADDLDALVVHLRHPTRHRRRWRSTDLLERSLGEVKRRTKVIGRFLAGADAHPGCALAFTCRRTSPPAPSIVAATIRSMMVSRPSESSGTASSTPPLSRVTSGGRGSELASQHVAAPRCRDALIRSVRP